MKTFRTMLIMSALFVQVSLSQGWEPLYTLPAAVAGATSTASAGYGVHLVGVYDGVAKHFWVGNDNTIMWSTLAVTGGALPQVTVYDGQVRVAMKVTESNVQKLRIYQSDDGGYTWTAFPDFTPDGNPPIFNLYAFSDRYGTHISWDDNASDQPGLFQNEVYYARFNNLIPGGPFFNFRNVTELSSPSQGGRPKVVVVANKACVAFCGDPTAGATGRLTSRDLNLDTGTWDSFYSLGSSSKPQLNMSIATVGDMLYTLGAGVPVTGQTCTQSRLFSYRQKDATTWTTQELGCVSGTSNSPVILISSAGLLHETYYENLTGVLTHSYNPATGQWSSPETIEAYTTDQISTSPMLTGGQYGNYYFFAGTYPSFHQHMRRKATVPTVTINSAVASGWNMTGISDAMFQLFKAQVYPNANSNAFRYEGGYVASDPLSINRGWWIRFPNAEVISYFGARTDSMRMIVSSGWNIIGSISTSIPATEPNVTSDPPGIISSLFYKYQDGGYVVVNTIDPGVGYWMRVSQNGRIVMKVGGADEGGGDQELASYDRFTVTDNAGKEQDLYVRNADLAGTTQSLEMPPAPPEAEFDARFSSGDIIRTVNAEAGTVDLSININEASYPVTLTWEINPQNGITYSIEGNGLGKTAVQPATGSGNLVVANSNGSAIQLSGKSQRMKGASEIPSAFALHQNYPNPFNPTTEIRFDLPDAGNVSLVVYDVLGRQVADLATGYQEAGYHSATWNAGSVASGVYFARFNVINAEGKVAFSKINKLMLVR